MPGWRLLCGSEGKVQGLKRGKEPWGHWVGHRRSDGREWCSFQGVELWLMHLGVCGVKLSLGEADVRVGELTPWRSAVGASPLWGIDGTTQNQCCCHQLILIL